MEQGIATNNRLTLQRHSICEKVEDGELGYQEFLAEDRT